MSDRKPASTFTAADWDALPLFLTAKQVAALLGMSKNTVYALAAEGQIPSLRVRHRIKFLREELRRYCGFQPEPEPEPAPPEARPRRFVRSTPDQAPASRRPARRA